MESGTRRISDVSEKGNTLSEKTWSRRFIIASFTHGSAIGAVTILLVGQIISGWSIAGPDVSRIISGGGAGTWFTFGYIMYIVVGVLGSGVSALFYYHFGMSVGSAANALAWTHLVLMNVGIAATAGMLMILGYQGGAAMLPVEVGGEGLNARQTHEIIGSYVLPIAISIMALVAGVIAGGVRFIQSIRQQKLIR